MGLRSLRRLAVARLVAFTCTNRRGRLPPGRPENRIIVLTVNPHSVVVPRYASSQQRWARHRRLHQSATVPGCVRALAHIRRGPRTGALRVTLSAVAIAASLLTGEPLGQHVNNSRDLLWQHSDGRLAVWIMNATTLRSGESFGPGPLADPRWRLAASGDFDGNGSQDVVFQHEDGRLAIWLMSGTALIAGGPIGPGQVADLNWQIRGAGDIDGDGKTDLVWQNQTTGQISAWLMNGTQLRDGRLLTPSVVPDTAWQIVGVADFNADGRADLLWQNQQNGLLSVWFMNGTSRIDGVWLSPNQVSDTNWKIQAIGDLNNDGSPDLIWRQQSSGFIAAWLMSGITRMDGLLLTPGQVSDTGWRIVGTTRSPGRAVALAITGAATLAGLGQATQLAATATLSGGDTQSVTEAADWQSASPAIATVLRGRVTAMSEGTAVITATYQGTSASLTVTVTPTPLVRVLYLIPQDRTFRSDYANAIAGAMTSLRAWYAGQLGGKTFSLFSTQPETCQLPQPAAYYSVDSWNKLFFDVQSCAPVSGGLYASSTTDWVLYADVVHGCNAPGRLGAGMVGLTMLGTEDLQGLIGGRVIDGCGVEFFQPVTRYIGGAGHEIGHTLGLSHPPGCDAGLPTCDFGALMWSGYALYPNTYFRADEKSILLASPFIR